MNDRAPSRALLLHNATLADGQMVDVRIADGRIIDVSPVGRHEPQPGALDAAESVDLTGYLLLPSFVEPHAHLDKAFLAETVPNPRGDLLGAIEAVEANRDRFTHADIVSRASRAVELMLANGVTAIRSHADVSPEHGIVSIEALVEVRERFRGVVDIQIASLAGDITTEGLSREVRSIARAAVGAGADLVGGCPHLEDDAEQATDWLLELAGEHDLPVDLHTDETLDPQELHLAYLARRVIDTGFERAVTASHCVSLGVQTELRQREVAELAAEAGIDVVTLPHTNLFLQGREQQSAMPRGLTALRALRAAGVTVAAGADNLQDPFNPVGRGDPLETASLMIMAAHLLPQLALESISDDARRVLRLERVLVTPGATADLVAVPAHTVREAIAFGPAGRLVIRDGRIVRGRQSN